MQKGYMGWAIPQHKKFADPRLAISKHIGWMKPFSSDTEYHTPEPDNFNYAMHSTKPLPCPVIENSVVYKCDELGGWWNVYYVPEDKVLDFYAWAEQQEVDLYWTNARSPKKRTRRTLLWTKKAQPEMTLHERLYTAGYYDKLQTQFNIDVSATLGTPRDNMPLTEYT